MRFVVLDVHGDVLRSRVAARADHWMPSTLLDSQLATLEPLDPDEDGVTVPVGGPPDVVVGDVLVALDARV